MPSVTSRHSEHSHPPRNPDHTCYIYLGVFLTSEPQLTAYFLHNTRCFWALSQSWQFISCKHTVFLSSEPESTVYFLQKHCVFELWTRVDSLFFAETKFEDLPPMWLFPFAPLLENAIWLSFWSIWGKWWALNQSWQFILCRNTVCLQTHCVFVELWTRVDSLFCAETKFEDPPKFLGFPPVIFPCVPLLENAIWLTFWSVWGKWWALNQSWQFILCRNTVFLHKHCVLWSSEPELTVYFVQKHYAFCRNTVFLWDPPGFDSPHG